MKEYKVIHINESHPRTLTSGNWHLVQDFPWVEKVLNLYLNSGYTVRQVLPPAVPGDQNLNFPCLKEGFMFLMEHETDLGEITAEDLENINVLMKQDLAFLQDSRRLTPDQKRELLETAFSEEELAELYETFCPPSLKNSK